MNETLNHPSDNRPDFNAAFLRHAAAQPQVSPVHPSESKPLPSADELLHEPERWDGLS